MRRLGKLSVAANLILIGSVQAWAETLCSRQVVQVQTSVRALGEEGRLIGPGFLQDDELARTLSAYKAALERVKDSERSSTGWSGLREAAEAQERLESFSRRVSDWQQGFAEYSRCLANTECSIGGLIKAKQAVDPGLASSLSVLADDGLERATERAAKASAVLRRFVTRAGDASSGFIAATLTCLKDDGPRSLQAAIPETPAPAVNGIAHRPLECAVAEKFPQIDARFENADTVAVARVVFKGNSDEWYSVPMKPGGDAFRGVLPQPKSSLKSFQYYIEATRKDLATNRTPEYRTSIVRSLSECKGKVAIALTAASVLIQGPAGAVAIPAGFASSGVVAAGAATATGAGAAASGSGAGGAGAAGTAGAAAGGAGLSAGAIAGIAGGVVGAGVAAKAATGGGDSSGGGSGGGGTPTPTPAPTPTQPAIATMIGQWTGTEDFSGSTQGFSFSGRCNLSLQVTSQSGGSFSGTAQTSSCTTSVPGAPVNSSGSFTGTITAGNVVTFNADPNSGGCSVTSGNPNLVGTVSGNSLNAASTVTENCAGISVSSTTTISLTRR